MSITGHVLSSQVIEGRILVPDDRDVSPILDFELGGIDLNDNTQGNQYQTWTARLRYRAGSSVGGIYLKADDGEEFLFYNAPGITEFSFTFDQNMQPFLCFMQGGDAKYYWWDPTISAYALTNLPTGSISPKCCLDDKRRLETGTSDILLLYARDNNLYYREQRDRYLTEYLLKTGIIGGPLVAGMNNRNRVQIFLGLPEYPETTLGYRYAVGGRRRVSVGGNPRKVCGVNYGY